MPIIQLSFDNPLNTSVQVGDNAYFSNPLPVSVPGNPLGGQWESTTTPHMTNDIDGVVDLGEILTITPWNGTNSFITCDMDQVLFNKYFSSIVVGGCNFVTPTIVPSGPFIGLANITQAVGMYDADCGPGISFALGNSCTSPNQCGHIYPMRPAGWGHPSGATLANQIANGSYCGINGDYPVNQNSWNPPLEWFFNDPSRHNIPFDQRVFVNRASQTIPNTLDQTWQRFSHYTMPTSGSLTTVQEIIDFQIQAFNAGSLGAHVYSAAFNGMNWQDLIITAMSPALVTAGYSTDPVLFNNFTDYPASYLLVGGLESGGNGGLSTNCTPGSYIMFSKDNKANMSSILGYYASVEYRNSSQIKSELFNVGTDFFESSK